MFCKSCGKQIDDDSNFCSFCGIKQTIELTHQVKSIESSSNQESNNSTSTFSHNHGQFNNSVHSRSYEKYDQSYKIEYEAIAVGIIVLITSLILAFIGPIKFDDRESYMQFRAISGISSIILRLFITVWVVNITRRQNRETFGWGIFAFILPSIALIVIATRKKLLTNIQIIEKMNHSNGNNTSIQKPDLNNLNQSVFNMTFSEWKKSNPKKSINDYYIEINKSGKSKN